MALEKRTWMYASLPSSYEIPGCKCGNNEVVYSEYKDRLWCEKCQLDFEPEHWGIFDGPIPWEVTAMLGINFDRIDLVRDVYQVCVKTPDAIEYVDLPQEKILAHRQAFQAKSDDWMKRAGLG